MIEPMGDLLRTFWRIWLCCLLLPLPALLFWNDGLGLFCFFLSCSIFVASVFRRDIHSPATQMSSAVESACPVEAWRGRMSSIGVALLLQWVVFSSLCLLLDRTNAVAPALALGTVIASLCIAPYLTLATRKPFAAVVLTLFAVACMKFVAGAVTVLLYGWHTTEFGRTTLTWTHPNLIVCTLLLATTILSMAFYLLGRRRFCSVCGKAA